MTFLSNIGLQLSPQLAFRCFSSPFDALVAVNGAAGSDAPAVDRFFSVYNDRDESRPGHHVISVSLDAIPHLLQDAERFATVSVVVVDFDMPEIDGLEFCRNIRNPEVRTILLTGKADERTAVRAFNECLIDRFIRKQEPEAIVLLNAAIAELQNEFFARGEQMLSNVLAVGAHDFLHDSAFVAEFDRLRKELHVVEHYLMTQPSGVLMLDASGMAWRLVVMDEDALQSQYEIAETLGAPEALLEELATRQVVPYFWRSGGEYARDEPDWKACLYPAQTINGVNGRLRFAVIPNPPGINLAGVLPYGRYLDRIDAGG